MVVRTLAQALAPHVHACGADLCRRSLPCSAEGADYGTVARWFYANAYESAACSRIWREWGKEEKNGEWNATSATLCSGLQVEGAGVCSGDSGEARGPGAACLPDAARRTHGGGHPRLLRRAGSAIHAAALSASRPPCPAAAGGPLVLGEEADSLMLMGVLSWGTGDSPCAPGSYEINAWASMLDPGVCGTARAAALLHAARPKVRWRLSTC